MTTWLIQLSTKALPDTGSLLLQAQGGLDYFWNWPKSEQSKYRSDQIQYISLAINNSIEGKRRKNLKRCISQELAPLPLALELRW